MIELLAPGAAPTGNAGLDGSHKHTLNFSVNQPKRLQVVLGDAGLDPTPTTHPKRY